MSVCGSGDVGSIPTGHTKTKKMYNFKNVKAEKIDILPYVALQHAINPKDIKIHIGTDCAASEGILKYFLVVAFRTGKTGVHFVYHKETMPVIKLGNGKPDVFTKLWKEAALSVNFANYLVDLGIVPLRKIIIEMDYNGIKETLSTSLIPATKGWATGFGYEVITKNEPNCEQIAVKAANFLCNN